jgi:hypothetical protein
MSAIGRHLGKRFRRRFVRSWHDEAFDDLGVESFRKLIENSDRRVFEAALQRTDIAAVDPGVDR